MNKHISAYGYANGCEMQSFNIANSNNYFDNSKQLIIINHHHHGAAIILWIFTGIPREFQ